MSELEESFLNARRFALRIVLVQIGLALLAGLICFLLEVKRKRVKKMKSIFLCQRILRKDVKILYLFQKRCTRSTARASRRHPVEAEQSPHGGGRLRAAQDGHREQKEKDRAHAEGYSGWADSVVSSRRAVTW